MNVFIAVSDAGREWPLNFTPNGSHASGTDHILEESPNMNSLKTNLHVVVKSDESRREAPKKNRKAL